MKEPNEVDWVKGGLSAADHICQKGPVEGVGSSTVVGPKQYGAQEDNYGQPLFGCAAVRHAKLFTL